MSWSQCVIEQLKAYEIRYLSYVPDAMGEQILKLARQDDFFDLTPLAREEEGVGVVAGQYMGGQRGAVLMPTSGVGNAINALASLAIPYQIPLPLFIGFRGALGEFNAAQVPMGQASSMGLGLALVRPQQKVIVLDGDGSLLMNLGSLTTAAARSPQNLIHIIWDNRQFELTGGQPTHTAFRADLAHLARGAGFEQVAAAVETQAAFEQAFSRAWREPGPWMIVAHIDSQRAAGRPPKSPSFIKHRFMQSLGTSAL